MDRLELKVGDSYQDSFQIGRSGPIKHPCYEQVSCLNPAGEQHKLLIDRARISSSYKEPMFRQNTCNSRETAKTPVGGYTPSTLNTDKTINTPTFSRAIARDGERSHFCRMDSIESVSLSDVSSQDELPLESNICFANHKTELYQYQETDITSVVLHSIESQLLNGCNQILSKHDFQEIQNKNPVVSSPYFQNAKVESKIYERSIHQRSSNILFRCNTIDSIKVLTMLNSNTFCPNLLRGGNQDRLKTFGRFIVGRSLSVPNTSTRI